MKNELTNILLIEDDRLNQYYVRQILQYKNINLIIANTGMDGIDELRKNKNIALVFLDIKMPDITGYDLVTIIRKKNKTIPIIAHTASEGIDCIASGFTDVLYKPFTPDQLVKCMVRNGVNDKRRQG